MAVVELWCTHGRTGTAIPGTERLCDEHHPESGLECTGAGNHLGNHMAVNGGFRPKWPNRRGFRSLRG